MGLSMIIAMTKDRIIGKDNKLPWPRIKEDLKHFRDTTLGHAVIMGRKTWESIPKQYRPLPGRTNIVLTRKEDYRAQGADHVFNSLDSAIEFARLTEPGSDPFIIGGATIYKEALSKVDKLYLTLVKDSYPGDTIFPEFDESLWNKELLKETDKATFYLYKRNY